MLLALYRVVVGDDDERERRRRDHSSSLLRSSVFCHSVRALCLERSAHLDGRWAGFGAIERFSVIGKHLLFRGVDGHDSG